MMTRIHLLGFIISIESELLYGSAPKETMHVSENQRVEVGVTSVAIMPNYSLEDFHLSCLQARVCRIRNLGLQKGCTFARRHHKISA